MAFESLHVDTSFLIDLQRERRRLGEQAQGGDAHQFLSKNRSAQLYLSSVALGEFAEGFARADDPVLDLVRRSHHPVPIDDAIALRYGALARQLRASGNLIGTNDLWIAAAALHNRKPILTANLRDFQRVPGLEVVSYKPSGLGMDDRVDTLRDPWPEGDDDEKA